MNTFRKIFVSATLLFFFGYGAYVAINSPDPQQDENNAETQTFDVPGNP